MQRKGRIDIKQTNSHLPQWHKRLEQIVHLESGFLEVTIKRWNAISQPWWMFLFFLISSKPSLRNHDGWCLQLPHSTWPTFQSRENNCGILLEKRAMWNSACLGKEIVCGPWKEILSVYCKDNYKWTWVDGEWKVFTLAFLSINKTWKSSPKGRMLFSSITCKMKCWLHSFFLLSLHVDLTLVMVIIFITTQVSAYVSQPVSAEMKGHSHRWWHYPNRNILGTHESIIFTFKPLLSHGFWVLF